MKLRNYRRGFTLIELLVVVAIIALLAVGVFPLYSKIMVEMKAKSAMKQAYQIHQALFAYASGNDQVFPNEDQGTTIADANAGYRQLFVKGLVDDEKLFFVKTCPWHGTKTGPDGDRGTQEDGFKKALEPGENHWGYVRGLVSDRDDSTLPIIMDGGTSSTPGKWSKNPKEPGGVWGGRFAVTVRIGGQARVNDLEPDLTVKDKRNGNLVDIFSTEYGSDPQAALNPLASQ